MVWYSHLQLVNRTVDKDDRVPPGMLGGVAAVSVLPFFLSLLGMQLAQGGSPSLSEWRAPGTTADSPRTGPLHTALEWGGVLAAVACVILALGLRRVSRARRELAEEVDRSRREARKLGEAKLRLESREEALLADLSALQRKVSELEVKEAPIQAPPENSGGGQLADFGRLVAEVAHEIKNPLASISMGVDYLSKHLPFKDRNISMVLEEMKQAVKRSDSVMKGLAGFTVPAPLAERQPGGDAPASQGHEGDGDDR